MHEPEVFPVELGHPRPLPMPFFVVASAVVADFIASAITLASAVAVSLTKAVVNAAFAVARCCRAAGCRSLSLLRTCLCPPLPTPPAVASDEAPSGDHYGRHHGPGPSWRGTVHRHGREKERLFQVLQQRAQVSPVVASAAVVVHVAARDGSFLPFLQTSGGDVSRSMGESFVDSCCDVRVGHSRGVSRAICLFCGCGSMLNPHRKRRSAWRCACTACTVLSLSNDDDDEEDRCNHSETK